MKNQDRLKWHESGSGNNNNDDNDRYNGGM